MNIFKKKYFLHSGSDKLRDPAHTEVQRCNRHLPPVARVQHEGGRVELPERSGRANVREGSAGHTGAFEGWGTRGWSG